MATTDFDEFLAWERYPCGGVSGATRYTQTLSTVGPVPAVNGARSTGIPTNTRPSAPSAVNHQQDMADLVRPLRNMFVNPNAQEHNAYLQQVLDYAKQAVDVNVPPQLIQFTEMCQNCNTYTYKIFCLLIWLEFVPELKQMYRSNDSPAVFDFFCTQLEHEFSCLLNGTYSDGRPFLDPYDPKAQKKDSAATTLWKRQQLIERTVGRFVVRIQQLYVSL